MFLSNTESIPGARVTRTLGLVNGNTVRAKHLGRDILSGFKNLAGGELQAYTELLSESRNEAIHRMILHAQHLGANAIINVRFTTASVAPGAAEIYAYGTAVVLEDGGAQHQSSAQHQGDPERTVPRPAPPQHGAPQQGAPGQP